MVSFFSGDLGSLLSVSTGLSGLSNSGGVGTASWVELLLVFEVVVTNDIWRHDHFG